MALDESIHGLSEYKSFRYTFTFSTIIAMLPMFYMTPTIWVMLRVVRTYLTSRSQAMDRHIFTCIALNFLCVSVRRTQLDEVHWAESIDTLPTYLSVMFFLFDYLRLSLPATGVFTSWCASVQPNHWFKMIFFFTFYFNYCTLLLPFFLCLIRLTILLRPRDNAYICPKIMWVALPLLFAIPLMCTAFMLPALGYCRSMGAPLRFGAVYIYYSGGWSGWRNSYIHLVMSVLMCILTLTGTIIMLLRLKKVTSTAQTTSLKTRKASTRAENSLTITMISSMVPFLNNTILTVVYLTFPDYVYYLMIFRPFGNDLETVMSPWILYLTHPMFQTSHRKISATSTISVIPLRSSAMS